MVFLMAARFGCWVIPDLVTSPRPWKRVESAPGSVSSDRQRLHLHRIPSRLFGYGVRAVPSRHRLQTLAALHPRLAARSSASTRASRSSFASSLQPQGLAAEDLIEALAAADVLEKFCHLPEADQDRFSQWIGQASDVDSNWRRIEALVLALRMGPLDSSTPQAPGDRAAEG